MNDIALLKLAYAANLTDRHIGFICLPSINRSIYPYEPMNGIAIGWGGLQEYGPLSYTLQQVRLPVISHKNRFCLQQIADDRVQFCAGFIEGGKDTCQGDRYDNFIQSSINRVCIYWLPTHTFYLHFDRPINFLNSNSNKTESNSIFSIIISPLRI